jgi:hypothetical protein
VRAAALISRLSVDFPREMAKFASLLLEYATTDLIGVDILNNKDSRSKEVILCFL